MTLSKPNFIAVAIIACLAVSFSLVSNQRRNAGIQLTTQRIDLSCYETPLANRSSTSKKRIAPLIRLDESSHLAALQQIVDGRMLLDFHATWCGPCKQQSQILEDIASTEDLNDSIMLKIDIDKHPALARFYNVTTVPKLVVVKKGKVILEKSGLATKATILDWLLSEDESVDAVARLTK